MEDQVHSMEDKIHKNRVRNLDREKIAGPDIKHTLKLLQ